MHLGFVQWSSLTNGVKNPCLLDSFIGTLISSGKCVWRLSMETLNIFAHHKIERVTLTTSFQKLGMIFDEQYYSGVFLVADK